MQSMNKDAKGQGVFVKDCPSNCLLRQALSLPKRYPGANTVLGNFLGDGFSSQPDFYDRFIDSHYILSYFD